LNSNPDSYESPTGNSYSTGVIISKAMLLYLIVIAGMYLFRPLYDPDFYWHLKTGQWIWQNQSLPHMDPFGIPPLPDPSPRNDFILTSYWLIQLILYAFYSVFGMSGIILFRWIIAGLSLLICARWTNIKNINVIAVLAIGTIQLLELYFIERPQFVSFVCFGVLLVILFRFIDHRDNRTIWRTALPLSLLMTIWSNMHGGFLIGQAILVYCGIAEGIKFSHKSLRPLSLRDYRILLVFLLTALIASFVNPNAINLVKYLPTIFDSGNYANLNMLEELSLGEYLKVTNDYTVLLYVGSIVVTVGALLLSKQRKNITWVGILAGTAFMGCLHMRLMPFFLVSAMMFMTKYVETEVRSIKSRVILIAILVFTTVYCVSGEFSRMFQAAKSDWVPANQIPVRAADFISKNNISGNVYTSLYWGGYMIWRMGPENKIFHDSRILNIQRAWEYNNSLIVLKDRRPYWKGLFNVYDIRVVILPLYTDDGNPDLLTQSISVDKDWAMVFAEENEAVFARSETGNRPQID